LTARLRHPETLELIALNNMGDSRVRPMKTAMPELFNDVDLFPGAPRLRTQIHDQHAALVPDAPPAVSRTGRAAGCLMWAGVTNSYYSIDRSTGVGGVF
jgi:methyl acetate hydrolase